MSKLNVEDLKAMSVEKLGEYAKEFEGEDLNLINTVIAQKEKVVADKEAKKAEAVAEKEKRATERAEKKAAAEKAKAERAVKREETKKAREAKLEGSAKAKEDKLKAKEEAKVEAEKAKEERLRAREAKKVETAKAKDAQKEARTEAQKQKELDKVADAEDWGKRLNNVELKTSKDTKSQAVRDCMAKGMVNSQIKEETGLDVKYVCDTTWRIKRQVEDAEMTVRVKARLAAEKEEAAKEKE